MWRRLNKILCKRSIAFTLVEILVAVIITSMIAIAVVSLYSTGNRTFFQIIETNKLSNESLVLTTMIEKDLAMGGFTHPVRGNSEMCESETGNLGIYPSDAVRITSDPSEGLLIISSCFDKSYSGNKLFKWSAGSSGGHEYGWGNQCDRRCNYRGYYSGKLMGYRFPQFIEAL